MSLPTRLLHRLDPERAHRLAVRAARLAAPFLRAPADDPILATTLFGRALPNPIGLAAGFDKHAECPDALLRLGFGFVEIGSVTPRPQPGNPRPRVFRLAEDEAVINRYGFNSDGVDDVARRLAARARCGIVGVNLGKNKETEDAASDYELGARALAVHADYLVVNVSSPNTPGLRALQSRGALETLLHRVRAAMPRPAPPLALKIAPDLAEADRDDIADVALALGLDAVIVSNTTVARPATLRGAHAAEAGGLSGRPLFAPSTALLREMALRLGGRVALIGVGGIASGADAYAKLRAGAGAVQLYTALVYRGPGLVRAIKRDLAALLRRDGFGSVAEAVGADLPR